MGAKTNPSDLEHFVDDEQQQVVILENEDEERNEENDAVLEKRYKALGGGWQIVDGHHLEKEYRFPDFRQALEFTNRIGELAEEVNHHPEICVTWGRATITLWTHKIDGLTESDFILAAKIDQLPVELKV